MDFWQKVHGFSSESPWTFFSVERRSQQRLLNDCTLQCVCSVEKTHQFCKVRNAYQFVVRETLNDFVLPRYVEWNVNCP